MVDRNEATEAAKLLLEMMQLRPGELVGVEPIEERARRWWLVAFERPTAHLDRDPGFESFGVLVDVESGESRYMWNESSRTASLRPDNRGE